MSNEQQPEVTTKEIQAKNFGEVRLISIADAHKSCFSPPTYKIDYEEHTWNTLNQIVAFAKKKNVDAIIDAGDTFHLKTVERNPLHFVNRCVAWHRALGIPYVGVGGNHDLKYGSLVGLKGMPLENLVNAGLFQLLDREELLITASEIHEEKILRPFTVRLAGASYDHGKAEAVRDKKKNGADWLVSVGHFWFGQQTGTFFGEPMFGPDYFTNGEPDVYVIGHHHDDQGVVTLDGKHFVSVGSINRTGAHHGDVNRRPAAAYIVISLSGVSIQVLRPKVASADEYLDLEKREQVIQEEKELEAFAQTLKTTGITTADPEAVLDSLDVAEEVKARSKSYLEKAEAEK